MPSWRTIGLLLWLVALGLVAWILSRLPLDSIAQIMAGLSWPQWLIWGGINVLVLLLGTLRWQVFTRLLGLPVGFVQLLLVRQAGQLISFLTPGPQFGGEPFQIYWLCRRYQAPVHGAVLSLGLDRFFELWINFSVLILGIILLMSAAGMDGAADWQQILGVLALLVLLLSILGWMLLRRPQWLSRRLEHTIGRWLRSPRLQQLDTHWQAMGGDLARLTSRGNPALWLGLWVSLLGWATIVAEMIIVLEILDVAVTPWGVILILVATRLALLLPLPGGIGTLEASVLWSFQILGLPATAALGVIALMRLRDALVLLLGLGCLHALR